MSSHVLVFDASPLVHFARARRLDALAKIVGPFNCVTTKAVRAELSRGVQQVPVLADALDLEWVGTVLCDGLDELYAFSRYMKRLGDLERNAGECSVLAWAEVHEAVAYVDDQIACNAGRARGVEVRRTLGLVIEAYKRQLLSDAEAQRIIEDLADTDARFPVEARQGLLDWARSKGLL